MALITKAIRGTQDVLPSESAAWQYIERTALSVARDYGFREIRTPVFEHTELFIRGVGDTKTPLRINIGVNLINAAVVGVLGVPGLGLLFLARWVLT